MRSCNDKSIAVCGLDFFSFCHKSHVHGHTVIQMPAPKLGTNEESESTASMSFLRSLCRLCLSDRPDRTARPIVVALHLVLD